MPHIIVKHSANKTLDVPALLHELHNTLAGHETITKKDIKTHALPLTHVTVGEDDHPNTMIHISVLMKPGRPPELKNKMSKSLHDVARRHADIAGIYAVSVETIELDAPTYHSSYKTP